MDAGCKDSSGTETERWIEVSAVCMNIHALFMHICVSSDVPLLLGPSNTHFSAHCSHSSSPSSVSSSSPFSSTAITCSVQRDVCALFPLLLYGLLFKFVYHLQETSKGRTHIPYVWVCVCVWCVKNFLFMLTFHLNVSLFVCQFEVLKSRWLELGNGKWERGNFDCNLCRVCRKEMSERMLHCCTCHWDSKGLRFIQYIYRTRSYGFNFYT